MKDTYVVKREANGRFSKKGYMFDDDKFIELVKKGYKRTAWRAALLGLFVGILMGLVLGIAL